MSDRFGYTPRPSGKMSVPPGGGRSTTSDSDRDVRVRACVNEAYNLLLKIGSDDPRLARVAAPLREAAVVLNERRPLNFLDEAMDATEREAYERYVRGTG